MQSIVTMLMVWMNDEGDGGELTSDVVLVID